MRLKITHLKAPWPFGAVVGDVLDLPEMPAWAAGKCVRVDDDQPVFVVNPEVTGDGVSEALAESEPQKAKGKK